MDQLNQPFLVGDFVLYTDTRTLEKGLFMIVDDRSDYFTEPVTFSYDAVLLQKEWRVGLGVDVGDHYTITSIGVDYQSRYTRIESVDIFDSNGDDFWLRLMWQNHDLSINCSASPLKM